MKLYLFRSLFLALSLGVFSVLAQDAKTLIPPGASSVEVGHITKSRTETVKYKWAVKGLESETQLADLQSNLQKLEGISMVSIEKAGSAEGFVLFEPVRVNMIKM